MMGSRAETLNVFVDADQLISDFFDEVERACRQEGVAFDFDEDEVEMEADDGEEEVP